MRDSSQNGFSFITIIGIVFAVIFGGTILILGAIQLWHFKGMIEIKSYMRDFMQKYQEGAPDLLKQKMQILGASALKAYGLLDECDEERSFFNNQRIVCKLPLGEFDFMTEYKKPYFHTLAYLHFNDTFHRQSCEEFLKEGWQEVIPESFWGEHGYIGIISEKTSGKMFFSNNPTYIESDGAQQHPDIEKIKEVCKECKGSRYCSVLMFFEQINDEEKVNFPAEFAGEKKGEDEEGEEGEVTKNGNTYSKKTGDVEEVVTYNDDGSFYGGTFSGGYQVSSYQGTYTSQGITSYTSYNGSSKTNILKKLDNITYDKKGKMTSYEKDSQKFLLIGDSSDCLIMDKTSNTKKLGDCSEPFQDQISFVVLNYDDTGKLTEISSQGGENALYKFIYDPMDGKLIGYCDKKSGNCRNVVDGKTVKDILKHDVPDTIGKFNTLSQELNDISSGRPARKRHRILTREEAMKYVKEKDNKVQIRFR